VYVFLHGNISADYCTRELFKSSKDLVFVSVMKKFFLVLGIIFFVSDVIKWSCFRPFWPTSSGPRPKPLDGSI